MKKLVGMLLIVFVLGLCSNVLALDLAGKFGFTGKGGIGIPMGGLADEKKWHADVGFGFGVSGEYFLTNQIGLGAYFGYNRFGRKDVEGVFYQLVSFGASGKYIVPTNSNICPYLKVAAGPYQVMVTQPSGFFSETWAFDMKFGFAVGGGVMFKASESVVINAEGMFQNTLVKEAERETPLGGDLQYMQLSAGITFLIGGK